MQRSILKVFLLVLMSGTGSAFVVVPNSKTVVSSSNLKATSKDCDVDAASKIFTPQMKAVAFTTLVTVSQPLMALAEDDYEYGAVSAPPLVPIVGGLLAILTALLPIALKGGEEAFEEMKATDNFGKGEDVLKKRR